MEIENASLKEQVTELIVALEVAEERARIAEDGWQKAEDKLKQMSKPALDECAERKLTLANQSAAAATSAMNDRARKYNVPVVRRGRNGSLVVEKENFTVGDPAQELANLLAQTQQIQEQSKENFKLNAMNQSVALPFPAAAATSAMNDRARKYNVPVVRRDRNGSLVVERVVGKTSDPTTELADLLAESLKASEAMPSRSETRVQKAKVRTTSAKEDWQQRRLLQQQRQVRTAAARSASEAMDKRAEKYGIPRVRRDRRGSLTVVHAGDGQGGDGGADATQQLANLVHLASRETSSIQKAHEQSQIEDEDDFVIIAPPPLPPGSSAAKERALPFQATAAKAAMNERARRYNVPVVRRDKITGSLTVSGVRGGPEQPSPDSTNNFDFVREFAELVKSTSTARGQQK